MANHEEDDYAKIIIEKTESQYRSIKDYQVKMTISMKIPAFRMPKKKYTVFFQLAKSNIPKFFLAHIPHLKIFPLKQISVFFQMLLMAIPQYLSNT